MNQFLNYPLSVIYINQPFGANPQYYARFLDSSGKPELGHMGIDFAALHGQPVFAPCDGDAFYSQDAHGGDGIYIRHPNNKEPQYDVILWHLCSKDDPKYKPLIDCLGGITPVKAGQLIGYADNTGAPFESSGDHLHLGLLPVDFTGQPLFPGNGFGGCIDPQPYFIPSSLPESSQPANPILVQEVSLLTRLVGLLKQLLNL